jgi:hypothetical protein
MPELAERNRLAPPAVRRAAFHPQRCVEPGARAMPPLTGVGERFAPRATWFCIDERTRRQVALALRVYPPLSRVDSFGIACSVRLA